MSYRKPPKPPFYYSAAPGQCKWCGEAVLGKNGKINHRANWHRTGCLPLYKSIFWPKETRKAVYRRDGGICCDCGVVCSDPRLKGDKATEPWEVDHIRPLYEANGDLSYWKLDNLATRCKSCHKEKSAREAGLRAAARKATLKT